MDDIDVQILTMLKTARDQCKPVPSYEEILAVVPRSSLGTIHNRIMELAKRGLIEKSETGKARSHTITQNGISLLNDVKTFRGYTRVDNLWPN